MSNIAAPPQRPRRPFRTPRALITAVAVVLALILAGLVGVELYTRNHAAKLIADAVRCEVQDSATVSFSSSPPVLWQYLSDRYSGVFIETAGNQVRSAKGMRVELNIHDVRVRRTADAKGSIGSLDGALTWSADGIKQSIQDAVPIVGSLISSSVTTNPAAGTVELKGLLNKATVKPQIIDNGLALQVTDVSALGHSLSQDSLQQGLDELTAKATKNYPLGIHADSVQVTDTGVTVRFSSQDAVIPAGPSRPCFADL